MAGTTLELTAGKVVFKVYAPFASVASPAMGERVSYGANVKIVFQPSARKISSKKIAFLQLIKPITYTQREDGRKTKKGWAVDSLNQCAWYGVGNDGKPGKFDSNAVTGAEPLAQERFKSAFGKSLPNEKVEEAVLVDTPREWVTVGEAKKCEFITLVVTPDDENYHGAVSWGYEVDKAGSVKIIEPVVVAKSGVLAAQVEAIHAWNGQAPNTKLEVPSSKK
jgi:hypothetical protein